MDPGGSDHSLLSRGHSSDIGSRYLVESGVYMSSFAATIFVAALVTTGVLLLSLVVALAVMLETCQNSNSGVVRQVISTSDDQRDYCNHLALHAELNKLSEEEFPLICKQYALAYFIEGRFLRDFNLTVHMAESYFNSQTPPDNDGFDVILMDVDVVLSDITYGDDLSWYWRKQVEDTKHSAHKLLLRLYTRLQARGWSLILFTRKPTRNSSATIETLISAGYGGWYSLLMRSDAEEVELQYESWEYMYRRREQLCRHGFRIASVISSQMDALTGPCLGKRNFRLANPIINISQVGAVLI